MAAGSSRSGWVHGKNLVRADSGIVATRHPLAAQAGVEILKLGGNAVDAAVAASLANGVVQPLSSTIGGGGFLVVQPAEGDPIALDFRYQASERASLDTFLSVVHDKGAFGWGDKGTGQTGPVSIAVPGSIPGLATAVEKYGELSFRESVQPAIELAREGFEMDWYGSLMQGAHLDLLQTHPQTAKTFLRDGRYPYRPRVVGPADVHQQPRLAETLEVIAENGGDSLRSGPIVDSIVEEVTAGGGTMTEGDFANYDVRVHAPNETTYRGHRVVGPPNMAGFVQVLKVMDRMIGRGAEPNDMGRLHLIAEILQLVKTEQSQFYGDGHFLKDDEEHLLSDERTEELCERLEQKLHWGCAEQVAACEPPGRNTIHISAVDSQGTLVSLTETILGNFGSGVTTESGILLNNGMSGFDLSTARPNSIAPLRRPLSNMTPSIVYRRDGRPWFSLGASGGPKILGAVTQVIANIVDFGMNIQDAISMPRVDVDRHTIVIDSRLDKSIAGGLTRLGHDVAVRSEELSSFEFANPCGAMIGENDWLFGGANPYQATEAIGYDKKS